MKIRSNMSGNVVEISRTELSEYQERSYQFAERALKGGSDQLKIEASTRLAINKLSFSDIYSDLDVLGKGFLL